MVDNFQKTWQLQEESKVTTQAKIKELFERLEKLEKGSIGAEVSQQSSEIGVAEGANDA